MAAATTGSTSVGVRTAASGAPPTSTDSAPVPLPAREASCGRTGPPEQAARWDTAAADFSAWRAGETAALDRLVRRLTPVLWQVARAYGLESDAAEDVVQSSWIGLMRAADSVRDPQAVLHWLTTTTRREAYRVARRSRREVLADVETLGIAGPSMAEPEESALRYDRAHRLWCHVATLSQRCQQLLRVIAFEDRPDYASLSQSLSMAVGSIGPTRGRCLKRLRELLADDPEWRLG